MSLDSRALLSSSEWREFLEGPSRTLKHLKLGFDRVHGLNHSGIPTLYFPNLEVLELDNVGDFAQWLLIPDSVKLITVAAVFNLPSISELWSWFPLYQSDDIINRLPKLETLCLGYVHVLEKVVGVLNRRKGNVEAGLQVDGVKMQMIKTLILPFNLSDPDLEDELREGLEKCRELVEVVEGNAHSRFIEVEY